MASIRTRSGSNRLLIDFRFQGVRCREQTALNDTAANRKKLEHLATKIEAEITLGTFEYANYFPNSRNVEKFKSLEESLKEDINSKTESTVEKNILFKDFAEVWFSEMKSTWRKSYEDTVRGLLDRQLIPNFGSKDVSDITKADLLHFRASLAKVKHGNQVGFSASHINRHMITISMILAEAADRYDFITPYQNIKLLKIPKKDIDPFTLDEINKFIAQVREDFTSYYTVRFFTGMRTGEINGLKWRYVNFETRQILIRETVINDRTEYTKTDGSQREIEMSQPVYDALKAQYEATGHYEYVFCNRNGKPLSRHNVTNRVWHPMLRHLGLRKRSPYQTRHTTATLWLASGENPEWIARQMGHANTQMLFRVYSRFVPNLTRQDGSAFEKMLNSNSEGK